MKNDIKFNILDGNEDYQNRATKIFLDELSDKFAYLDEE